MKVLLPLLLLCAWCEMWRRSRIEIRTSARVCRNEHNLVSSVDTGAPAANEDYGVLLSCLEHAVPSQGIRVVAGGLGNVAALYVERLPCRGKFVFARVGGVEYGPNWTPGQPIVFLDGDRVEVTTLIEGRVEFVALAHPLFLGRTRTCIYPDARQPEHFLAFKSLWNRSVAELLVRYRTAGEVQVYHALDFHGGLAPLYVEASGLSPMPVALTLHNALYQGSLMETLDAASWAKIEQALQLPCARALTEYEGDFNMLHSVVGYHTYTDIDSVELSYW